MDKNLILQAGLHVLVGAGTPVLAVLSLPAPITARSILVMVFGAIIGGAGSLKAFLSTTYAASPASKFLEQS